MSGYKIYQPMKYATARNKDILKEALNSDEYGIQLKVDGSSYILAKDLDGTVHLYGDKISKKSGEIIDKIDNVPHLKEFAEEYFPVASQILVEITCKYNWTAGKWEERSNSKYVNSIMLSGPEKAIARQCDTEWCGAYMFDILFWDGVPIYQQDFIERYEFLEGLYENYFPKGIVWLSLAELITENKSDKITEWLSAGEEGGVLKLLRSNKKASAAHAVSEIGATAKRPMHTAYKIKQVDTVDVIIIDVEYPTKEYKGKDPENYPYRDEEGNPVNRLWALDMINAFVIGVYNEKGEHIKIGTVASGLDDEMRADAFADPQKYFCKVIEVDCMSVDKEARSLRHPRLIRMRPDKRQFDCTVKEVFA